MVEKITGLNVDNPVLFYNPKDHEFYQDGEVLKGFFYEVEGEDRHKPVLAKHAGDINFDPNKKYCWIEGYSIDIDTPKDDPEGEGIPTYNTKEASLIKPVTFINALPDYNPNTVYYYIDESGNYRKLSSVENSNDGESYKTLSTDAFIELTGKKFYEKDQYYYLSNNDYKKGIEDSKLDAPYFTIISTKVTQAFYEPHKYYVNINGIYELDRVNIFDPN